MKADILTIHFGVNYGSCLQVYALSESIKKCGIDCKVIDYVPKRYDSWEIYGKNKLEKYPFPLIALWYLFTLPEREYQRSIFKKFLKRNLSLTRRYKYPDELKKDVPLADIYIAGSDQIWNYDYNTPGDYTYMFDFLKNGEKKFAYAASIGKSQITEAEKSDFKKYLSEFSRITVREKSAKDLLNDCAIKCEVVLDPTFLLSRQEWKELAIPMKISDSYILVYVMDNLHKRLIDIAAKLKEKYNHKIYVITFKATKDKRVDKEFHYLKPERFLTLFDNAEFVVTNSFHGTAFSVNLNKQFVSVGKDNYNSRIRDLLELVGLRKHYISNKENLDVIEDLTKINYQEINEKLDMLRKESMTVLLNFFK